jgi:hypothetical protein
MSEVNFSDHAAHRRGPHSWTEKTAQVMLDGRVRSKRVLFWVQANLTSQRELREKLSERASKLHYLIEPHCACEQNRECQNWQPDRR